MKVCQTCKALIRTTCPTCTRARQQSQDARRGSSTERGYNYRWSLASRDHLRRYPLCGDRAPDAFTDGWSGECKEQGRITEADVTDHIRPHKGDADLFWDSRNRQSLCRRCNSIKAAKFEGGFGHAITGGE